MALSAGTRQAVGMATGWLVVACGAAVSLIYFSESQSVVRVVLGLQVTEPRAERQSEPVRGIVRGRTVEIRAGAVATEERLAELPFHLKAMGEQHRGVCLCRD